MISIKIDKETALVKLQEKLDELDKFIRQGACSSNKFTSIKSNIEILLTEIFEDVSVIDQFKSETMILENAFSLKNTKKITAEAAQDGINYLNKLVMIMHNNEAVTTEINNEQLSIDNAKLIIRRILNNFYKHIEVMYNSNVHGNGKILKEDLDKIKIGNEYDVQRILYSLIKPIFPLARIEVSDDTGYGTIRYDIIIEQYNMIIEVKCTRDNMTEKKLTEELGADAFHYQYANIFFFIYDKEKIIKNLDAFIQAYTKNYSNKSIETIVIQPVILT